MKYRFYLFKDIAKILNVPSAYYLLLCSRNIKLSRVPKIKIRFRLEPES